MSGETIDRQCQHADIHQRDGQAAECFRDGLAAQAVAENPKVAEDYRAGKEAALKFLVGQVMKLSRGKANPQLATEALRKQLAK